MTHGADTSFLVAVEIREHRDHAEARRWLEEVLARGDRLAIAPQVLSEFVRIVIDARRFAQPLSMEMALEKSERWWNAAETEQVQPTEAAVVQFHRWMREHQLGRKRLLDTMLAATWFTANVASVLTLNPADFAVFGEFTLVPLAAAE